MCLFLHCLLGVLSSSWEKSRRLLYCQESGCHCSFVTFPVSIVDVITSATAASDTFSLCLTFPSFWSYRRLALLFQNSEHFGVFDAVFYCPNGFLSPSRQFQSIEGKVHGIERSILRLGPCTLRTGFPPQINLPLTLTEDKFVLENWPLVKFRCLYFLHFYSIP